MKSSLLIFMMIAFAMSMSACGRSNTIYSDSGDGIVGTDGRNTLPTDFTDQSVNHANVAVATNSSNAAVLRFSLTGGSSSAGAFHDAAGTGNRALLSIGHFEKSALSGFSLSVASTSTSSSALHISLVVDLDCSGQDTRTLESTDLALGTANADPNASVWSIDGADLKDSSGTVVLTSRASATPMSLQNLLTAYPSACVRGDRSDAPDAPVSSPVSGVLLSIGSETSTSIEALDVSTLTINGQTYQTWGQR